MKNIELRIGNYLQDAKGRLAPVEGLLKNNIKAYSGVITTMPLKPIPLTEEWLLKFSWQLVKGNDFYLNSNFCIGYDGAGRLYCNGDYKGVNVFYVHQLQNLYFALTGEELTLKQTESI